MCSPRALGTPVGSSLPTAHAIKMRLCLHRGLLFLEQGTECFWACMGTSVVTFVFQRTEIKIKDGRPEQRHTGWLQENWENKAKAYGISWQLKKISIWLNKHKHIFVYSAVIVKAMHLIFRFWNQQHKYTHMSYLHSCESETQKNPTTA